MDFGNALHLALSASDDSFATFDKALGKTATQNGIAPQVKVLGRKALSCAPPAAGGRIPGYAGRGGDERGEMRGSDA